MSTFDDFMIDEKVKQDQEVVQLRRELTELRAKLADKTVEAENYAHSLVQERDEAAALREREREKDNKNV